MCEMNKANADGKIMMTDQNCSENLLLLVPHFLCCYCFLILRHSNKSVEFKSSRKN